MPICLKGLGNLLIKKKRNKKNCKIEYERFLVGGTAGRYDFLHGFMAKLDAFANF